jgi:CRISPR-associated endoribonuclease Cas6
MRFLTPTRIEEKNDLITRPAFHQLIKHLLRRVSLLAYYHCDIKLDLDFKSLIEESKTVQTVQSNLRWHDWERYSNRQRTRMSLGGFVGDITFTGDFQKWLPLLRLGEYLHVGKATSFGLGKYEIKQG